MSFQEGFNRDKPGADQKVFQLLFLHTENQTVEAWETNSIECEDLIKHLNSGESVFISPKKQEQRSTKYFDEKTEETAYFKRI